jgi:hypothetical protein
MNSRLLFTFTLLSVANLNLASLVRMGIFSLGCAYKKSFNPTVSPINLHNYILATVLKLIQLTADAFMGSDVCFSAPAFLVLKSSAVTLTTNGS